MTQTAVSVSEGISFELFYSYFLEHIMEQEAFIDTTRTRSLSFNIKVFSTMKPSLFERNGYFM